MANFNELEGKTLTEVNVVDGFGGEEKIVFKTVEGDTFTMKHFQDCCECVYIEDICGDLSDLIGQRIEVAEERGGDENRNEYGEIQAYTFYTIRTVKGTVDIRWNGSSNGYYSIGVAFVTDDEDYY